MLPGGKIRIAAEIVIEWLDRPAGATCPNCGRSGVVRQLLDIDFRPPDRPHRFVLQVCPACTVRFVDNTHSMDYGHEDVVELGWQTYQVQQGAGIWPIVGPLMRLPGGPGSRVLEIGGGYGFGLDFCARARGWRGEGYDPSLLSAFGRDELGLTVHQGYFGPEHVAQGPWDVLIATEVIEHVVIPPEFLRLARAALGEAGILLLTTPDAAWIAPETSADRLMQLLSPGVHVVLQTQASLTAALLAAGFAHVQVERTGMSLVAFASASAFTKQDDPVATRAAYRAYLLARAALSPPGSDLALGFAGRGLFEAANDGDAAAAAAAWSALVPAVQARFGLDLEHMDTLPAGAADASLSALLGLMPLNLGMICFARAMDRLALGAPRASVVRLLRVAAAAVAALQGALAKRSITDALYVELGPLIADEILICEAEAGAADCVAPLAARGSALGWRGFIGLVNAGAYGPAASLRAALGTPGDDLPAALWRDAWLSLGHLGLGGGDIDLAIAAADALGEAGAALRLQAFIRLVNAGSFKAAVALADALGRLAEDHADAGLAFAMLRLGQNDPAGALTWLDRLRPPPAGAARLRVQIFIRLVNAGAFADAQALATAYDIAALAGDEVAGRDAALALAGLDLAVGDPAASLARLQGHDLPAAEVARVAVQAFIRLVNAGRFEPARALAAAHDVAGLAAGSAAAADAGLALAMLDLAAGDPAACLARLPGLDLPADQMAALRVQAFIRLVNARRFAEAAALAADIPNLAAGTPAADDAALAGAMLDLHTGDPAAVLGRLGRLPPAARHSVVAQGFIRLVNAGRFAEAREVLTRHDVAGLAAAGGAALQRALIALDLNAGDPAAVAGRLVGLDLPQGEADALLALAFIRLVNAGRFEAAAPIARNRDIVACADADAVADARLALALLGLHADPAALARQLPELGLAPAQHDALLVQAFIRLVNAGDYAQALALGAEDHIIRRAAPDVAQDARRAAAALVLHAGDPASIPDRLPGLGLDDADQKMLLAQAFIRLVNAGRFADAAALADAHNLRAVPLADMRRAEIALALNVGDPAAALGSLRAGGFEAAEARGFAVQIMLRLVNAARFAEAASVADEFALTPADAGPALALIALETGGAARVPALVAGLDADQAARLCLIAFTRLVNEGGFADARAMLTPDLAATLAGFPGAEGNAARLAAVRLDLGIGDTESAMQRLALLREAGVPAATLGPLAVEGFVRLVNDARDAAAAALWRQGVPDWLFACAAPLREDALAARVTLALRADADAFMALEEAAAGGLAPARLAHLAAAAFVATVNRADYAGARQLLGRVEPGLIRAAPPLDDGIANAMFAAGMLFLQEKRDWRRAAAMLARLRDGLTRRHPAGGAADALFWPALRAEFIVLQRLKRGEEAVGLLKTFIHVYPPCPEDLLAQITVPG